MKHQMFSVFDEKAGAYLPPFMFHKKEMAQRVFGDCVNDPEHAFGRHPADYTLFEIATFDDHTGRFEIPTANRNLGNALEYKAAEPQQELQLTAVGEN